MAGKDKKYFFKKPLYTAGIASIVLIFVGFAANSLLALSNFPLISALYSVIVTLASILSMYGFYVIGDKYKFQFLKVLAIIGMVGIFVFYLGGIIFGSSIDSYFSGLNQTISDYNQTLSSLNISANLSSADLDKINEDFNSKFNAAILPALTIFTIVVLIYVIYSILWGVALIKLRNQIRYARVAGILNIIGASTLILFVGLFVLLAAFVFEVRILFDQAKKFKEY